MEVFKNLEIKKCLHSKTQNNEGVNALIWKPTKHIFAGFIGLYLRMVASAVINFNDVMVGILRVLAKLGIIPGSNTVDFRN